METFILTNLKEEGRLQDELGNNYKRTLLPYANTELKIKY